MEPEGGADVLRSKRDATRYQILVQIAERQPAVSQQEIADAIGVTAQAVSDYLQDLVAEGFVEKEGRGRYTVTNEGVDWLISQTDRLQAFLDHVSGDVLEQVDVTTAIAAAAIGEGQTVSLVMRDGVERAVPGDTGGATAVAVTAAEAGQDVGVTNIQGVIEYDLGTVTVLRVPSVQDGGARAVDSTAVTDLAGGHDLVAAAETEALVAAQTADVEPDIRFGTVAGVREAATRGLDVLLLVAPDALSAHTDALREGNLRYEVVDGS